MTGRSISVPGLHHGGAPIPVASVRGGILISGRISGHLPDGNLAPTAEQTDRVFSNARLVVEKAGGSMRDVIRMTFVLADDALRAAVNDRWLAEFPDADDRPVRHISLGLTPPDVAVQCELFAVLTNHSPQAS